MADEATRRRLTTILAADVVGYSRLSAADEEATLRRLKEYREVVDRFIARHEGRIFGSAGDSVLAEFASAVEAVRCAMAIQDELRVRNAALVEGHRMHFRIGINIGDVMVDGENLLGDGVNVAARLESIAQPGGICISGSTFEQVKSKLSVGFEDIGPQEVKNIPYPVPAFRIGHAPVALKAEGGRGGVRQLWSRVSGGRRRAVVGAVVVLVVAGLGAGAWVLYPRGPKPLSAFPENVSTDDLRASDLKNFATGITVAGHRMDGLPFKFHLNPDMTASYELDRSSQTNGFIHRETGSWRVEDYRLCVTFRQFNHGQEACPRIVKQGTQLSAARKNGDALDWTVTR
jgi:class 3 adenylate cyclase